MDRRARGCRESRCTGRRRGTRSRSAPGVLGRKEGAGPEVRAPVLLVQFRQALETVVEVESARWIVCVDDALQDDAGVALVAAQLHDIPGHSENEDLAQQMVDVDPLLGVGLHAAEPGPRSTLHTMVRSPWPTRYVTAGRPEDRLQDPGRRGLDPRGFALPGGRRSSGAGAGEGRRATPGPRRSPRRALGAPGHEPGGRSGAPSRRRGASPRGESSREGRGGGHRPPGRSGSSAPAGPGTRSPRSPG